MLKSDDKKSLEEGLQLIKASLTSKLKIYKNNDIALLTAYINLAKAYTK